MQANALANEQTNTQADALTNEPPFRVWHDHNGKPIEARWTGTAKDQKSITLETRSGRRIRAVLYKLSEEDRKFVQEQFAPSSEPARP